MASPLNSPTPLYLVQTVEEAQARLEEFRRDEQRAPQCAFQNALRKNNEKVCQFLAQDPTCGPQILYGLVEQGSLKNYPLAKKIIELGCPIEKLIKPPSYLATFNPPKAEIEAKKNEHKGLLWFVIHQYQQTQESEPSGDGIFMDFSSMARRHGPTCYEALIELLLAHGAKPEWRDDKRVVHPYEPDKLGVIKKIEARQKSLKEKVARFIEGETNIPKAVIQSIVMQYLGPSGPTYSQNGQLIQEADVPTPKAVTTDRAQ